MLLGGLFMKSVLVRPAEAWLDLDHSRHWYLVCWFILVWSKKVLQEFPKFPFFTHFWAHEIQNLTMSAHFGHLKTEFYWYHRPRNGRKNIFWKFLLWHCCVTSKWTIEPKLEVWSDLYLAKLQPAELARSGRTSTDYWKYSLKSSKIAYNDENNGDSLEFLIFIINISWKL